MKRGPWAQWTPELDEVLALMFPDSPAVATADLLGVSEAVVRQRASVLGVRQVPGFKGMWARKSTLARSPFTPEIAEVIELLYPDTMTQAIADFIGMPLARVHAYASKHGWSKTPEFVRETARARAADPDHPMHQFHFKPGLVPKNKGVKGWQAGGRSVLTQFKKGAKNGHAAQHWVPIGSYRINDDGVLDQKVADAPNRGACNWEGVHRLVWKRANGPIPAGHVVRFKEGRKSNRLEDITVDALECITLAENGRRNIFHNTYPPEVAKLIVTRAHMQRMINKRQRAQTEERT